MAKRHVSMFGFFKPSVYMRQQAITRGIFGGSKSWMVLGVFVFFPRLLRRLFAREEIVVAREPLRSRQVIRLEALGDLTKAERKAIRKAR